MSITLHIGFPKTGTSSVQQILHTRCSDKNFGKPYPKIPLLKLLLFNRYDFVAKICHAILKRKIRGENTIIISDEDISIPFRFDRIGGIHPVDRGLVLKRLSSLVCPDKIVIVQRNRLDFLNSWFRYQLKRGRITEYDARHYFGDSSNEVVTHINAMLDIDLLKIQLTVFFPNSRIIVVQYEDGFSEMLDVIIPNYSHLNSSFIKGVRKNKSPTKTKKLKYFNVLRRIFGLRVANKVRLRFGRDQEIITMRD